MVPSHGLSQAAQAARCGPTACLQKASLCLCLCLSASLCLCLCLCRSRWSASTKPRLPSPALMSRHVLAPRFPANPGFSWLVHRPNFSSHGPSGRPWIVSVPCPSLDAGPTSLCLPCRHARAHARFGQCFNFHWQLRAHPFPWPSTVSAGGGCRPGAGPLIRDSGYHNRPSGP